MTTRVATCRCGQLRATCTGAPARVSICHCLNCQKRSGSVFATQARYAREQVSIEGASASFRMSGESGTPAAFGFCATCGSTLFWEHPELPGEIYISVGAFADPTFPPPTVSVFDERRHPWVCTTLAAPPDGA